jgi:hypothetical protein
MILVEIFINVFRYIPNQARKWQIIALEAKTNTKEQYFKEGLKEAAETMSAQLT